MYLTNMTAFFSSGNARNDSPFSGAFSLFAPGGKSQTPLQKLSSEIITGQKSSEQIEDLSRTAQIKKDAFIPKDSSGDDPLDDIPTGLIELYMDALRLETTGFGFYARELSDFKEHLQGMDDVIQGYQDILDGKASLPEGQNMECLRMSCELAKRQREEFFEYGMARFGEMRFQDCYDDNDQRYKKAMNTLLGGCQFAQKSSSDWEVDPNASDIYSEIDRVLKNVQGREEEMDRGIGRLLGILYKRGCGKKYQGYLDAVAEQKTKTSHIAKDIAAWNQRMEQLMQSPLQEAEEEPLQAQVPSVFETQMNLK